MQPQTSQVCFPEARTTVSPNAQRLHYIDYLRWTMILLVISMHSADKYSPLGNWYFSDRAPLNAGSLLFFDGWQMYLQSFFMGLLFFVAGYFVPSSFDRKGPVKFVRDRLFRLGLPVLFICSSWGRSPSTFFSFLELNSANFLHQRVD
jgi:peptidoglycan/LPS O-acetylase OafA/YrhL